MTIRSKWNDIVAKLKAKTGSVMDRVKQAMMSPGSRSKAQKDSLEWFYKTIRASKDEYKAGSFNLANSPLIGGMYHFIYDPKHKATLKYYDKFPLAIPIEVYNDGVLCMNLHYLPPILRAKLLDLLIERYKRSTNARTYMEVSYSILKAAAGAKMFEPCLHRYLTDHIRSGIVEVTPDLWEEVAFLPSQKFEKATHQEVWADSKKRS